MYMSKKDLLKIAKEHNLRGCVNYTKPQLINRLRGEGLLPEGVNENDKDENRYKFINKIRESGMIVEVQNVVNGEFKTYPSIYACAKALGANPGSIRFSNGRLYGSTYKINIIPKKI